MEIKVIIQGCINNDRVCQEKLYRTYFPKMLAMCYRYTSDEDKALMIVNNGFLKVFQKIDTFKHKGSFEGWIRRIVFNSISDFFRKENKYLKFMVLEDRDNEEVSKSKAESQLYYDDIISLVEKLPQKTQNVFRLFAIEGYGHREIGLKLNISDGTSKWHLSEARKILKKLLIQQETYILENHGG